MKRILLVEGGQEFWPRIRGLLKRVNAVVTEVRAGEPDPVAERPPELVVVGEDGVAALAPEQRAGALLVLREGRDPEAVESLGTGERQVAASSAIRTRPFLALTSRLLGVSERRLFRAVISVRRPGGDHPRMGVSREFSLTGLSFSLAEPLDREERVVVSFHIPGAGRRVSFGAEVVRSFEEPDDGSHCHGARFVGLSAEESDLLRKFVLAEE